jgi:hypothetical protein
MLILVISYASSLRVYVKQRDHIAETKSQIARSQRNISTLHDEIHRWHDDDYVRIQARERLGWVQPGETGYRVIGSDGKPVTKHVGVADDSKHHHTKTKSPAWYKKLWGATKHADRPPKPKPANSDPQHTKKPITEDTKPKSGSG